VARYFWGFYHDATGTPSTAVTVNEWTPTNTGTLGSHHVAHFSISCSLKKSRRGLYTAILLFMRILI